MKKIMDKFGELKLKVIHNLTEGFNSGNKSSVKEILKLVTENKEFKDLYLFYEEVENLYIEDKESAKLYVENVEKQLQTKSDDFTKYCDKVNKKLIKEDFTTIELYNHLDTLSEENTLRNIGKKILSRHKLVEHIISEKQLKEVADLHTSNENLLNVVLTNNFNNEFGKSLTKEEKVELKTLLSTTDDQLETNFITLKEDVSEQLNGLIVEEKSNDLKNKFNEVLSGVNVMKTTKYNYYKLQQLKKGL